MRGEVERPASAQAQRAVIKTVSRDFNAVIARRRVIGPDLFAQLLQPPVTGLEGDGFQRQGA